MESERPAQRERRPRVHLQVLDHVVEVHVHERIGPEDRGVVDEHVQPSRLLERAGEQRLHLPGIRQIGPHQPRVASPPPHLLHQLLRRLSRPAVVDD